MLLGHGGFTTIGVNAAIQTLPALLAGWMYAVLSHLPWIRRAKTSLLWPLGCVIGMTSVLATLLLAAVVLLWGGAEDWHQIVWLVFYAHLPIVGIEGVVLGFTVSFLARVKPDMLDRRVEGGGWRVEGEVVPPPSTLHPPPLLLLAILSTLLAANPAQAHRLDAGYFVLPDRQVRIESWFDLGGIPHGAKVQVFRPSRELLAEGQLDANGYFVFHFTEAEPLEVIVSAGAGHRKTFVIPREELEQTHDPTVTPEAVPAGGAKESFRPAGSEAAWRERSKDALLGITFLLALAAFVLGWRNGRKLKSIRQTDDPEPMDRPTEQPSPPLP